MNAGSLALLRTGSGAILGTAITAEQLELFRKYLLLLQKWNAAQRLVGSDNEEWLVRNVVLDSLLFHRLLPAGASTLLDIGSGAGIPGVPLAVAARSLDVTLLESRRKRASFLRTVVRELGIANLRVVNERLEVFIARVAEPFDVAVARCAGPLSSVVAGVGAVKVGGLVLISGPPRRMAIPNAAWLTVEAGGIGPRNFIVIERRATR